MLTIKDLQASKQLDSKEMAGVIGGQTVPAVALNLLSPQNNPKQADLLGLASSFTGAQSNTNMQSDNDTNIVAGSGQVVNYGGNSNSSYSSALSFADNFLTSLQS